jgi:hypothetical protein
MIYIEQDTYSSSLYTVDKVGGYYYGWNESSTWEGTDFTLYPDEGGYTQTFLAPSILDRW